MLIYSHCLHSHICSCELPTNAYNCGYNVFDLYSCLLPGAVVACLYWAVAQCIPVWIQMYMYILTGEGSTYIIICLQAVYTRQASGLVFYKSDPDKTHMDHKRKTLTCIQGTTVHVTGQGLYT